MPNAEITMVRLDIGQVLMSIYLIKTKVRRLEDKVTKGHWMCCEQVILIKFHRVLIGIDVP